MILLIYIFLAALIATLLLVPKAKNLAFFFNAIDKPSERKVHSTSMPRLGGIAIYGGFMLAVLSAMLIAFILHKHLNFGAMAGILIGATLIMLIGALDDIKTLKPTTKLVGQFVAAFIPIYFGVQISFVSSPFSGIILLGVFAVPVTLLWIVGITNAINFADGLDGLACGITAISSLTLFIVALRIHQLDAAFMMIALAGAAIGFLRYNFNPASIFLGDSGSLFLGYVLAASSVIGVLKSTILFALLIPIFILGVPIYDTASVIMRRVREGQPIFSADKRHLHHRLLKRGFSHRQVVLSIYAMCALLSLCVLAMTFLRPVSAIIVFLIAGSIILYFIYSVKKHAGNINPEE